MTRKASIHFKPVKNVRFAVSHSERTDLSEPGYLLPKEHQLENIVVAGSLSEEELSAIFIRQKAGMTGQAKARGSSPFWEGVVVLSNTDGKEQEKNLKSWSNAYEKATGHKVLHMSIHLDEGYIDKAGAVHYNPHSHVIVSRMDERNRVVSLDRKQLAKVQDLTAETLKMERGSTLEERLGRRGRKHIDHQEFRLLEDAKRLEILREKNAASRGPKLEVAALKKENRALVEVLNAPTKTADEIEEASEILDTLLREPDLRKDMTAQIESIKAVYAQKRQAMKDSGSATQKDYQELKKAHELTLAELKESQKKVKELESKIADLEATIKTGKATETKAEAAAPQFSSEHNAAKSNISSNIAALIRRPEHQDRSFEDLAKMAYWRGVVAEKNKGQPSEAMREILAGFDEKISDPQVELPDIPGDAIQKRKSNDESNSL